MSLRPEDYAIDTNYRHWEGDKAEDYIGPFFFMMDGENTRTAFRVAEHHCNAHDSLHGGILMARWLYRILQVYAQRWGEGGVDQQRGDKAATQEIVLFLLLADRGA